MSPLLFAMFINDLPSHMLSHSSSLLFADDFKIYRKITCAADAMALQEDLNHLCEWSRLWGLQLNPSKCKSFRMTLKKHPIQTTYFVGSTALEDVETIRDLGVILDTKLTFEPHVDGSVKKANRALGLIIRSFQKLKNERRAAGNISLSSVRTAYCAHVRSVLEYCSVVWAGASETQLGRIERIQHKFLMWFNSLNLQHNSSESLLYDDLLSHYNTVSLKSRRKQHDIMFMFKIQRGITDSSFLLDALPLHVSERWNRHLTLFHVPAARVNTVRDGLFGRVPRVVNEFLRKCPHVDIFHNTYLSVKKSAASFSTHEAEH